MTRAHLHARPLRLACAALALSVSLLACSSPSQPASTGPATQQNAEKSPSVVNRPVVAVPALDVTAGEATAAVAKFIDWAADSRLSQREEGRAAIEAARANDAVAQALVDAVFSAQKTDHSRALVALSVLGELRNPVGEQGLIRFVNLPFPAASTEPGFEGENPEQTALGTLQAKAAEGLAYMGSESGTQAVLTLVAQHPSRIVRAAAITAYLYNNPDNRQLLQRYVQKGEQAFVDRPIRDIGESGESFNAKLTAFLHLHPELAAPDPPAGEDVGKDQPDRADPGSPPGY
ncbi:hypothetical protein E7T09_17120 [Deinococcus sp. KSM4-11]|uniref:hypothetical protein n=1 Tax=Deinococcus sp. KSM4-11 TaxID=2568654 RepID=UPI0010A3719D|nr:hypothetical protein [Deinococcus sp. KSM4-11]THF85223.1 hypothetical protein E7T09_17120 [Deinococcus sp. KSM4-11]